MKSTFATGEPLVADPYGPLACFQLGQDQFVVDLRTMQRVVRLPPSPVGVFTDALLDSQQRQWFGFEWEPDKDKYHSRLRGVSLDTCETMFLTDPIPFTWSLIRTAGGETVGLIHEKKGLVEYDCRTGEVVNRRPECRDYNCVDPSGLALVQKSRLNIWLEVYGRHQPLDVKAMRRFLDFERARLPRPPYLTSNYVDLGSKRPITLFHPVLARSMVIMKAEKSIIGFSIETGELVFTMSPLPTYELAFHPERGTLIALGWDTLHADLDSRVLMEIDLDTRQVLSSRNISCVSANRKEDPAGYLSDRGRYSLLPDNSILTVGTNTIREVPKDLL